MGCRKGNKNRSQSRGRHRNQAAQPQPFAPKTDCRVFTGLPITGPHVHHAVWTLLLPSCLQSETPHDANRQKETLSDTFQPCKQSLRRKDSRAHSCSNYKTAASGPVFALRLYRCGDTTVLFAFQPYQRAGSKTTALWAFYGHVQDAQSTFHLARHAGHPHCPFHHALTILWCLRQGRPGACPQPHRLEEDVGR